MTSSSAATAPVRWAQRASSLYITICLPDVTDHKIGLSPDTLVFSGTSNGKYYTVDLQFFKEIETNGSRWSVLPLSVQMELIKKDDDAEFWTRLLKDKGLEKTNVTVDWDRYVDEDEECFSFNTDSLEGGNDFSNDDMSDT